MDTFIVKRGKVDCINVTRLRGRKCAKFADAVSELAQNFTLFLTRQFIKYVGQRNAANQSHEDISVASCGLKSRDNTRNRYLAILGHELQRMRF